MATAGTQVLLAWRDPKRAQGAAATVAAEATGPATEVVSLDLAWTASPQPRR